MNAEWEENVAKTSQENEELLKKGNLNCCFLWELRELWTPAPASEAWSGESRETGSTDMPIVAGESDAERILSGDGGDPQQKRR